MNYQDRASEAYERECAIRLLFRAIGHVHVTMNSFETAMAVMDAERILLEAITTVQFSRVPFWRAN
jgi:hypothetical protein